MSDRKYFHYTLILFVTLFTLAVSAANQCVTSDFILWKNRNLQDEVAPEARGRSWISDALNTVGEGKSFDPVAKLGESIDDLISEIPESINDFKNWMTQNQLIRYILQQEREMNITAMMGAMEYKWPEKVGINGMGKSFDVEAIIKQMSFKTAFNPETLRNQNVLTTYGNTSIGFSLEFDSFQVTNMEIELLITEGVSRLQRTRLGRVIKCPTRLKFWKNCRTRRINLRTAVTLRSLTVNGKIDIGIYKCNADVKNSGISCLLKDGWDFVSSKLLSLVDNQHVPSRTAQQILEAAVLKRIGKLELTDLQVSFSKMDALNVGEIQFQKADLQYVQRLPPSVEIPAAMLEFSRTFTQSLMNTAFVRNQLTKRIALVSKGIVNKEIQKYSHQFGVQCSV